MNEEERNEQIDKILSDPDVQLFLKEARLAGYRITEVPEPPMVYYRFLGISNGAHIGCNFVSVRLEELNNYKVWDRIDSIEPHELSFPTWEEAFEYVQKRVSEL